MRRHQTGGEGNGAQHLRRCRARVLLARSPGTIDETRVRTARLVVLQTLAPSAVLAGGEQRRAMPKRSRAAADAAPAAGPRLTVASEEMARSRSEVMAQMWREGSLCDCEVSVDGRVFTAHRIVLAACSTFMRSAFTVGLAETATASVVLEEVEPAVFEAVLEFVYAGTCTFDESLSLAVLQAASRLGITLLETQVVAHITERIDPATCLEVWKAGDALSLPAVVEAAQKCATEAFVEVAAQDAWLGVAAPWLECLLASDELATDKEEQVFEALTRWHAAQRPPPSHEALDRLLALVRWPLMEQRFVAEQVNTSPMVIRGGALAVPVATAFQAVAYGTRPKSRLGKGTDFRFESAFDTNGILHHIGTRGGTAAYRNPHELGEVVSSCSSPGYRAKVDVFVQHAHATPVFSYTSNTPQSWMAVDLGEGRSLVVDHYCLRADEHDASHKLRSWELQGSLDGQTWQTLRAHQNDTSLPLQAMSTAAWSVDAGAQAFRHFRIYQTGANSSVGTPSAHHLMCAGIELYGRATFKQPLA